MKSSSIVGASPRRPARGPARRGGGRARAPGGEAPRRRETTDRAARAGRSVAALALVGAATVGGTSLVVDGLLLLRAEAPPVPAVGVVVVLYRCAAVSKTYGWHND